MDNLYEVLEHMSNVAVLVFSKKESKVLFCNRAFREAFKGIEAGKSYEHIFPVEYEKIIREKMIFSKEKQKQETAGKKEKNNRIVLEMPEFGGITDVDLDELMWDGRQEAVILYFSSRYINEEAKFRSDAEKAVNSALTRIYPVVAAVNLTKNAFMIFETNDRFQFEIGDRGNFDHNFCDEMIMHIHAEEREAFLQKCNRDYLLKACRRGEDEIHMEFRLLQSDGQYHWTALRFVRINTEAQGDISCVILMRNVDYRMNQQIQLRAALDATYAAIPGGIAEFLVDEPLTILHINSAFCELVGKTPEDYANGYREHIHQEDRDEVTEIIHAAAEKGEPFDIVYRVYNGKTGRIHWVQCRGVKTGEQNGIPIYLGIRLDVTELKNAQIALREEQARADLAMGGTGNLRFEYDRNEDRLSIYYQDPDDATVLRRNIVENYSTAIYERKEIFSIDIPKMLNLMQGDEQNEIEIRMRNMYKMKYEWYRIKSSSLKETSGRNYVVGIIENIEKEKRLESTNQNLQEQIGFVIRDSFKRIYMIDIQADRCMITQLDSDKTRKPVYCSFSKLAEVYLKNRVHPLDRDNVQAKYIYLTSGSAFEKNRNEIYFDARIRDGFGPEYHWYSLLIKPTQENKKQIICMVKGIDELKNQEELERRFAEQLKYQKFSEKIIDSLGVLVEFRDGDSGAHIMRTRELTRILLNYVKNNTVTFRPSSEEIEKISTASAMHDVGKISIPDAILNKPGRLTPEEFSVMKTHSEKGYRILKNLDLGQDEEFNKYCLEICRWHHERYDGNGYPDHLVGDEIPIWSQIVGIVDVYDALVSPRVYKNAYTHEEALEMIINGECGSFNPDLLAGLRACADQLRACYE